ncbi:MAG: bifunctional UDP-N-acetylmuramoyl-tripeptide:D-alanyl-D-alanine ligase/alanine racemase [Bacteroidales bacterium]|nr:bifunctional UDP-N-acetylmuramoyl-tripeptide:D-alanyl-D-alanine ligase/alanine racemase [Bacteroidales bacterium]
MDFLLSNISNYIKCEIFSNLKEDFVIKNLVFDSRKLNNAEGTIFFAIKTLSNNGQKYIPELYLSGVRVFVVENLPDDFSNYQDNCFLVVKNTIEAFQSFAKFKRDNFTNPIIAITGSNGKTIVKDWIVQLIENDKKVCQSPRSYNSQIGVALSVWNLKEDDDLGVIEAGISQKDEMEKLEQMIRPSIGIMTNIGDAHQVYFKSIEEKIQQKIILFKNADTIIYCSDRKIIHKEIINAYKNSNKQLISWGYDSDAVFRIEKIVPNKNHTTIYYIYRNVPSFFSIPFIDKASIENSINSFIGCLIVGIDKDKLTQRTINLQSLEMRLQMKEGINHTLIINDSYSSDITSLELALTFLNQQNIELEKIAILSDITQSFIDEKELYSAINKLLIEKKINNLIGIGEGFKRNKSILTINNTIFSSTQDFLKKCSLKDYKDQIILIKGARSFEFERISRFFEKKTHETVLEINLSAIAHNVNYFKSKLKEGVKLMAMVKAHSYGSGGFEIASTLANQNIDYLAVAFSDEGVELRNNGIKLPIMVMSPEKESIAKIIHYDLEPEVYSISILKELIQAKKDYDKIGNKKELIIHIKLDTGMHRLGMENIDIKELVSLIKANKDIKIKSIFSHLAGSDNPNLDFFTLKQIEVFETLSKEIMEEFNYPILRHIANSAAIIRFPQAQYDMVRLGIGMYGIGINQEDEKKLRYVHRLKTILTMKRDIGEAEAVGYNMSYIAKEPKTIGVIPIGYADGLNRKRGNENGKVWINGYLAPIIGNVCMDMCMIDITNIECVEGDEVVIFGEEYAVNNIAKELDTIAYEVFTTISSRVKRVFYQE